MADWIDMFDAQLAVEPPPGDDALAQIPARRGVALLAGQADEPIQLLPAADIRARVRNRLLHPEQEPRRNMPDLSAVTRKIFWKLSFSHFETDLHFLELALSVAPKNWQEWIAFKPAWFVHVDASEAFPHFQRTRDVLDKPGLYLGPVADGRSSEKFIDVLQDAFDLCRDFQCLRRSPQGARCSYAQMGRCLAPCDGSIPMEQYRRMVADAAEFAAGRRAAHREKLASEMKRAAAELKFERASTLKQRIERLSEFDKPAYAFLAPAEEFAYVIVQSGAGRRQARAFLACRGEIEPAMLDFPLAAEQVQGVLAKMAAMLARPERMTPQGRYRMGLVSHYLFSGENRRGLIVRYAPELSAQELSQRISSAAESLGLKAPAPRKPRKPRTEKAPPDAAAPGL
jgi:hypothetical protein